MNGGSRLAGVGRKSWRCVFLFCAACHARTPKSPPNHFPETAFATDDAFIKDIHRNLDLENPRAVFSYIFAHLNDEVTVFPTENYYYFIFPIQGNVIWGSLALFADSRDQGEINLGYIVKTDKRLAAPDKPVGGSGAFTAKDGVIVKKINDFAYSVSADGRTVVFKLNDVGVVPPQKAKLLPDEIYVGPSFDESGLKFFLVFNQSQNHLYWILNEDGFVAEKFTPLTDDIVIGDRTEFAFYADRPNRRKILIGVEGWNVLANNWYDGPFDQMPDNYVKTGKIEVKKYLEAAYPNAAGKIDQYGNYLGTDGSRVAVAPYLVYFSREDLVSAVESCKKSSASPSEFCACVTQQIFNPPEEDEEKKN